MTKSIFERTRKTISSLLSVMIAFGFFAGWIMVVGPANELRLLGEFRDWTPRRGVITQSYARSIRRPLGRLHIDVELAGV